MKVERYILKGLRIANWVIVLGFLPILAVVLKFFKDIQLGAFVILPGLAAIYITWWSHHIKSKIVPGGGFEIEIKDENAFELRKKYLRKIEFISQMQYALAAFAFFIGWLEYVL